MATKIQHVKWNYGIVREISSKLTKCRPLFLKKIEVVNCIFFLEWIHSILCVHRFESCWPAIMKDSNGVVIVFNPDVPSHLKEIETWHSTIISSQGLLEAQCLLIAHHKPGCGADNSHPPLGNLSTLRY